MTEVLISYHRPRSLTESEMHAWLADRGDASDGVLRVGVDDDSADEQLAELMMEMRLLGLRPAVVDEGSDRDG